MGYKLTGRLLATPERQPENHREMRALLCMAHHTHDGDDVPVYFGGWEPIAVALGQRISLESSTTAAALETRRSSAQRVTRRALSKLEKDGHIVTAPAGRGRRPHYALTLDLPPGETWKPATWDKRAGRWEWERVTQEQAADVEPLKQPDKGGHQVSSERRAA